jgi:uncharacterized protein
MQINKKLITYFLLAYFFSWIAFIPLALNKQGVIFLFPDDVAHARTLDVWHAFGGFGPLLSAIVTTLIFNGKKGLLSFFNSYSVKKLTATGWLLALSPFLIFGTGILVAKLTNGEWLSIADFLQKNNLLNATNLMMWIFPLFTYGFGEEGGWRGFALPQLQSKLSALASTAILSIFWLGWHVPTFFYRYHLTGYMLVGFILGLFAGAIWMTFLFNYTKGSLLAVSLWHLTFNFVSMIGMENIVAATMSTIVMILAVIIVIKYGKRNLAPVTKTEFSFDSKTGFA